MEARQGSGRGYIPGGAYGLCQRCGFTYRHYELRREWTSLLVCEKCHDPRPPQMDAPVVYPEGLPVANPSPDLEDSGPNTTTPDDL